MATGIENFRESVQDTRNLEESCSDTSTLCFLLPEDGMALLMLNLIQESKKDEN